MRILHAVLPLALLVACSEQPKQAQMSETLPNLLVPPNAEVVSREGGEDALKIRFRSSDEVEPVAAYYRNILSRPPWRLISDTKAQDGRIALYAEGEGPPMWVTIWKAEGAPGTFVDLAGAKTKPRPNP